MTAYDIPTQIQCQNTLMMVDSGCNLSILPRQLMSSLPAQCHTPLSPMQGRCALADGKPLELNSSTTLTFTIGSWTFGADFLVANISNTILLGLDFFEEHGFRLDFHTCTSHCGETKMQCTDIHRELLQVNVQLRNEVRIPGRTERIVMAYVNWVWTQGPASMEPSNQLEGTVVASSLADPKEQQLPLRLLNYTDEEIVISARKVVAVCAAF